MVRTHMVRLPCLTHRRRKILNIREEEESQGSEYWGSHMGGGGANFLLAVH